MCTSSWTQTGTASNLGRFTYWNYDVWGSPGDRATLPQVLNAGLRVLNYNGYYQFWVPRMTEPQSDRDYTMNDLRTVWNIGMWTQHESVDPKDTRIVGATFSIWSEHSKGMDDATIIERGTPMLKAFAERARS